MVSLIAATGMVNAATISPRTRLRPAPSGQCPKRSASDASAKQATTHIGKARHGRRRHGNILRPWRSSFQWSAEPDRGRIDTAADLRRSSFSSIRSTIVRCHCARADDGSIPTGGSGRAGASSGCGTPAAREVVPIASFKKRLTRREIGPLAETNKYLAQDHMSVGLNRLDSATRGRQRRSTDWGAVMTRSKIDLESLSTDELWELHHKVSAMLKTKIKAQTKVLEWRLAQINARLRDK
jgi:hypothetical protein